jgi:hypothetical protein
MLAITFVLIKAILSGSLAPLVLLAVFFGILYWKIKKRLLWKTFFICMLLVVLLNPIKMEYRAQAWAVRDVPMSFYDKVNLLGTAVRNRYLEPNLNTNSAQHVFISRLNHISMFSYVIAVTPNFIPHWKGETYRTLFTSFIPRALWPEKPKSNIGQDFGHRYGILQMYDQGTAINLPWLIEFYINFGKTGVIVGMFLIGIFFRTLLEKFRVSENFPIENALAVTVVFGLFFAESNFALMVGGVLPQFIILTFLVHLLTKGEFANSVREN